MEQLKVTEGFHAVVSIDRCRMIGLPLRQLDGGVFVGVNPPFSAARLKFLYFFQIRSSLQALKFRICLHY